MLLHESISPRILSTHERKLSLFYIVTATIAEMVAESVCVWRIGKKNPNNKAYAPYPGDWRTRLINTICDDRCGRRHKVKHTRTIFYNNIIIFYCFIIKIKRNFNDKKFQRDIITTTTKSKI